MKTVKKTGRNQQYSIETIVSAFGGTRVALSFEGAALLEAL